MLTAFVWGFGVACGALLACSLFMILFCLFEFVSGKAAAKAEQLGMNEATLQALLDRNEISKQLAEHMSILALTATMYNESLSRKNS